MLIHIDLGVINRLNLKARIALIKSGIDGKMKEYTGMSLHKTISERGLNDGILDIILSRMARQKVNDQH